MGGISVAAAIVVGLLSSFVQSLGLTIQRKSHVQDSSLPLPQQRQPHRRPLWLLGFGIYITSNIFSTIFQLDALPIVILAPLGAVSLIYNALLARLLLGDHFGPKTAGGTAMVAAGAVMIAVFGVVQEEEHTLEEIMRLWGRPAFLAFFSVVTAGVVLVLLGAHISSWQISRHIRCIALPPSPSGRATPPSSMLPSNYASPHDPSPIPFRSAQLRRWSSPVSPRNSILELDKHTHPRAVHFVPSTPPDSPLAFPDPEPTPAQQKALTLTGLAFAAASGVLSGMSLVLAKAAVELLVITLDHLRTGNGENQFKHVQSWFLVAGLILGAVLQLVYLNYSLTFASPALVCPLAFCFFNLSSIFDGLVFYDQFGRLAPHQITLVSLGVALLLLGVWVVSALQPTGQGGVDVGTWVEEDAICMEDELTAAEDATLFGGDHTDEPGEYDAHEHEQYEGLGVRRGGEVYPQPQSHIDAMTPTSPAFPTPMSPTSPWSPSIPTSPTLASSTRRRRPRFGTLIPELAPAGTPTGFAIGLSVASPGFVLRPESISGPVHPGLRGRSRSEGMGGIEALMRGDNNDAHIRRASHVFEPLGRGLVDVEEHEEGENEVERQIRGWEQPKRSFWRKLWRSNGGVKLPADTDG